MKKSILKGMLFLGMVFSMLGCAPRGGGMVRADDWIYPVAIGEDSMVNAPTLTGGELTGTNRYEMLEWDFATSNQKIGTINVEDVEAIVFQLEIVNVTPIWRDFEVQPGFVTDAGEFSVCDSEIMNQNQIKLFEAFTFLGEDGSIRKFNGQYFNCLINESFEGYRGLFIFETKYFVHRWGNGINARSAFLRFDCSYGSTGAVVKLGEVGYLTKGATVVNKDTYRTLVSIADNEPTIRFDKADTNSTLVFPSEKPIELPEHVDYPFASGDNRIGFKGATTYISPKTQYTSGDNYQYATVNFGKSVDLSKASYLAIQYWATAGAPGLQYKLVNASNSVYSIVGHDGAKSFMLHEDGSITINSAYVYDSSNVSDTGCLLIPMKDMSWETGTNDTQTKTNFVKFDFVTNTKYNYNFSFTVGAVGYYTGSFDKDFTYHEILGLDSNVGNLSAFSTIATDTNQLGKFETFFPVRSTFGEVQIDFMAKGRVAEDFPVWEGGALADVTMTTDTYGLPAVSINPIGLRPGKADPYAAVTLENTPRYNWGGAKGVAFWTKNECAHEAVFNIELDFRNPNWKNDTNARFNIQGGFRFYLYDVNTKKQTIALSHPTVTLPVGFEGWVYMPFAAFKQADWSVSSVGAMPSEFAISNEGILAETTKVTYLAITVQTQTYCGLNFSVNNFGAYYTSPTMDTALVSGNSIYKLMELDAE